MFDLLTSGHLSLCVCTMEKGFDLLSCSDYPTAER